MEYDAVLTTLPAYTSYIPSLSLATLNGFLSFHGFNVKSVDCSFDFFHRHLKKFKLPQDILPHGVDEYGNWGISNWFIFHNLLGLSLEEIEAFLTSLCPVCSRLYLPIFYEFNSQKDKTLRILDEYIEYLDNFDTGLFGFSLVLGNAPASLYVAARLKKRQPSRHIILGGPESNKLYRGRLYARLPFIDLVVNHDEGEIPLLRILQLKKEQRDIHKSPGIAFYSENRYFETEPPPPLNLNDDIMPTYEHYDLIHYDFRDISRLSLLCSKGCPSHCRFCNENAIWGPFRSKRPQKLLKEILLYHSTLGIDHFDVVDNSFNATPVFEETLDLLKQSNFKIIWGGNCEFQRLNSKKVANFRRNGLEFCDIGLESGSAHVLQLMNKQFQLEKASLMLEEMSDEGIQVSLYIIVGFPGEKLEDFSKTLNFLEDQKDRIIGSMVSVFTLQNGSHMFQDPLVHPIPIEPEELNAWTYQTLDGTSHEERRRRFLLLKEIQFLEKKRKIIKNKGL